MPKVMVAFYNTNQIGGPNIAMNKLIHSYLKDKYEFVPIIINDKLGKIFRIKVLKRLTNEIKNEKPDVIYFSGLQLHGFYIALAAKLAGYSNRTIMVVRGTSTDAIQASKYFKFLFGRLIEPATCRMTQITHTVCTRMASHRIIENNVSHFGGVIYNAAPIINCVFDKQDFRREIHADTKDVILVYSGRLKEEKGIGILLNAMKNQRSNIKLVLVGDGMLEYFKGISHELGLDEQVFFLGKRNDVFRVLSGADIFVYPTFYENLSNALLEACAVGLPAIVSNVGGNPEVVRNEIDGFTVPPKDVKKLANAIERLASDEQLRKTMGFNAKARMETVFSQNQLFKKIDNLFEQIINIGD